MVSFFGSDLQPVAQHKQSTFSFCYILLLIFSASKQSVNSIHDPNNYPLSCCISCLSMLIVLFKSSAIGS